MFHMRKHLVFGIDQKSEALKFRIFLILILMTTLFGMWLLLSNKSTDQMNRESIDALLKIIYTSPDEELVKLIPYTKSYTGSDEPEDVIISLNQVTDRLLALYQPYCTEKESLVLMYSGSHLRFQEFADTYGYQISVDHVEIQQNENDPRNYDFEVFLQYGPVGGELISLTDSGSVQCLEEGKVTYLRLYENKLLYKVMELEEELSQLQ
jgi:hypothetical protein